MMATIGITSPGLLWRQRDGESKEQVLDHSAVFWLEEATGQWIKLERNLQCSVCMQQQHHQCWNMTFASGVRLACLVELGRMRVRAA